MSIETTRLPGKPTPDERPIPEPWECLIPTPEDCARVMERNPALSETGFYPYEARQQENDQAPDRSPSGLRQRPPIPITTPAILRQTAIVRFFIRSAGIEAPDPLQERLYTGYDLQTVVARWSGEYISLGACIAAAFLEGCSVSRAPSTANAYLWLRVSDHLHELLRQERQTAIHCLNGALASVPNGN
jgi:hypothetical protein